MFNLGLFVIPNKIPVQFIEFHKDTLRNRRNRRNVNYFRYRQSLENDYFANECKLSHLPHIESVDNFIENSDKVFIARELAVVRKIETQDFNKTLAKINILNPTECRCYPFQGTYTADFALRNVKLEARERREPAESIKKKC